MHTNKNPNIRKEKNRKKRIKQMNKNERPTICK